MPKLPGGRGPLPERTGVVSKYGSHRCPPLHVCTTGLGGSQGARQHELQGEQSERKESLQRTNSSRGSWDYARHNPKRTNAEQPIR
jgi:hypothetical protein